MSFQKEDMAILENLSKFNLNEEEREQCCQYMNFWINKYDELLDVNTTDVEPLISVVTLTNVLRDDIASKMVSKDDIFKNAPEKNNGHFQVPKTIE